jgi:mannose-6-phosphate isomerase-like protein (cupin superfamily)
MYRYTHCLNALILGSAFATQAYSQTAIMAEPKTYAAAAEITALLATLAAKPPAPMLGAGVLHLDPYQANLEYRTTVGSAAIHEKEAELFFVLEGAGSLVTGGTLVAPKRHNDNVMGTAITGGTTQKVAKGDVFIVPENTPHWFNAIDGKLVLISFHVPRTVPGAGAKKD